MAALRPRPPGRRPLGCLPEMPESRSLESQLGVPSCCLPSGRSNRRLYSEEKLFWQTREPLIIVSVFLCFCVSVSSGRARRNALRPSYRALGRPLGGPVLLSLKNPILRSPATKTPFRLAWFLMLCVTMAPAQKPSQDAGGLPKYDLHSEMKTKGVVDEVKLLPLGAKRDITELVIKNGDDKVYIYVCPKAFQEQTGINFAKGDEVAVTGSKVKLEALDIILARQLGNGTDTLLFRDDKGNPVWDWRTGK